MTPFTERFNSFSGILRRRRKLLGRIQPKAAVIVGSGPSAPSLSKNLPRETVLIAVNNAWRIKRDFDFLIYPDDFPADRLPPRSFRGSLVTNSGYMPAIDASGGIIFCGATMAFAAGYWAIAVVKPKLLGYFASDMVYPTKSSKTHFYGQGTPDPLRKDISLGSLEAKSARLFCLGLINGTLIVNHSQEPESRLVFPRLTAEDCQRVHGYDSEDLKRFWHGALASAQELIKAEGRAPFDALRHDYWVVEQDNEAVKFTEELDKQWLQLVPEIARGWSELLDLL